MALTASKARSIRSPRRFVRSPRSWACRSASTQSKASSPRWRNSAIPPSKSCRASGSARRRSASSAALRRSAAFRWTRSPAASSACRCRCRKQRLMQTAPPQRTQGARAQRQRPDRHPDGSVFRAARRRGFKVHTRLNLTNAVMAIGGRGISDLVPLLSRGSEGLHRARGRRQGNRRRSLQCPGERLRPDAREAGTARHVGRGLRHQSVFHPRAAIDAAVTHITSFIESVDGAKIQSALTNVVNFVASAITAIGNFAIGVAGSLGALDGQLTRHRREVQADRCGRWHGRAQWERPQGAWARFRARFSGVWSVLR